MADQRRRHGVITAGAAMALDIAAYLRALADAADSPATTDRSAADQKEQTGAGGDRGRRDDAGAATRGRRG